MTHDEAEQVLGVLVGATTGWRDAPDETFRFYLAQIKAMRDAETALEAVTEIGATWDEARRPPVSTVNGAYQRILTRRAMAMTELPAPAATSLERGRVIAHEAYIAECKRQGNDPRPEMVDAILAGIGSG